EAAAELAAALEPVAPDGWGRVGVRRGTERFTVAGLARLGLHEAHHHLTDAGRVLNAASGDDALLRLLESLVAARRINGPVDERERAALDAFDRELAR